MTIKTNLGRITIAMDASETPCAVTSFAQLAERGFFDGTHCHRLTTKGIYVLQCGDPTGSGVGGPGYRFADEFSGEVTGDAAKMITYSRGAAAMANSGPNTNGSQFFLVYRDSRIPPLYELIGKVTAGIDVVDQVAQGGVAGGTADGAPKTSITIQSMTVI